MLYIITYLQNLYQVLSTMTPKSIFNTEDMTQNNIFSDFDCIEEVNTVYLL